MKSSTPYEIRERLLEQAFDYYRNRADAAYAATLSTIHSVADGTVHASELVQNTISEAQKDYQVNMDEVMALAKQFNEFVSGDGPCQAVQ